MDGIAQPSPAQPPLQKPTPRQNYETTGNSSFGVLAQVRRGTRRLEGSPELLLWRTRETVREGELDVRFLQAPTKLRHEKEQKR